MCVCVCTYISPYPLEPPSLRILIPGSGGFPGEGNGNPLQYSCLENPTDRGAWQATVHGVTKSRTRLSDFTSLQRYKGIVIETQIN